MKVSTLSKGGDAIETYEDNGVFLDGRAKTMKKAGGYPVKDFGYEAVPSEVVVEGKKEYDEEGNLVDDGAGPFAPGFTVPQAYADMCRINIDGTSKDPKMRVYKKTDNSGDTKDIMELTKEDRKKQDNLISYIFTGKYPGMERATTLSHRLPENEPNVASLVPFLVRKNPKK